MHYLSPFTIATALLLTGCGTASPQPFNPPNIQETVPIKDDIGTLTIIAPTKQIGLKGSPFIYYDYFLDCKEDRCKIGKMKYGQYIIIHPSYGFHTIYVTISKEGFANSLLIHGDDQIYEQHINIQKGKRHYISQEWTNSFSTYMLEPFSIFPSILKDLNESDGKMYLYKLLEQHETVGGRLNDYGAKGTIY